MGLGKVLVGNLCTVRDFLFGFGGRVNSENNDVGAQNFARCHVLESNYEKNLCMKLLLFGESLTLPTSRAPPPKVSVRECLRKF